MISVSDAFISFIAFNAFEWIYSSFVEKKLARNASALTHATGAVALNALHIIYPTTRLFTTCTVWSTGYFLYDTYFMVRYTQINALRVAFIYHHMAAIYLIGHPPNLYYGDQILFLGELSNIPSYFVYHYLHTDPTSTKLAWWLLMQKLIYAGIRVPVLTWVTVNAFRNAPNKFPILVASPVYLMGLAWTAKLLTK